MSLPPPNLDDRDFRSLVEEARTRIPTYTGEWTNFNDSDPGMTLVQLHAWLTETLLYRVNRLPDLAYVNFLNLLGTTPQPARAAQAELTFRFADLDRAGDPLTVLVPKGVQVGVDDPDLDAPITFETNETLRGINAAVAAIIAPGEGGAGRRLCGEYDADEAALTLLQPFRPFGDDAAIPELLIGLLLRPTRAKGEDYFLDRFPEGELNLTVLTPQVFEPDASGAVIDGPFGRDCRFPWQGTEDGADLVWSVYTHSGAGPDLGNPAHWSPVSLRGDETAGLRHSGHVWIGMPPNLPMVGFAALDRDFWAALDLSKPPASRAELVADLAAGVFAAADLPVRVWRDDLGLTDPPLQDLDELIVMIEAATDMDLGRVDPKAWLDLGYSAAPAPHGLVWLRARLDVPRDRVAQVSGLHLNTIRATAAVSRTTEVLGTSAGRPNQTFRLKRAPVLIDPATGAPDLEIELVDPTGTTRETWRRGDDFYGAGRDTPRYLLDPGTGVLTFGDGVNGRIPVAGSRVVAARYRVGGGALGNVGAGKITALKTALPQVDSVTNLRAAAGGSDAETLDEARLRAPQLLRTRDRAVAAQDFADLALRTPGVALRAAFALPLVALDNAVVPPAMIPDTPGAVTVVVLPVNRQPTPQPSEEQLRLICAWLNQRRLITTELYVTGPRYVSVTALRAEIVARADADLKAVQDAALAAVTRYFHPLDGGEDGRGWPFGGAIYRGNVFDLLLAQPGVARVADLKITLDGLAGDDCADMLPVDPGTLVHLPQSAVVLEVRYGRSG